MLAPAATVDSSEVHHVDVRKNNEQILQQRKI